MTGPFYFDIIQTVLNVRNFMEISQAANFLAASILISLGVVVIGIACVVLNNIAHKYWKPIKVWQFHSHPDMQAYQITGKDNTELDNLKK